MTLEDVAASSEVYLMGQAESIGCNRAKKVYNAKMGTPNLVQQRQRLQNRPRIPMGLDGKFLLLDFVLHDTCDEKIIE